MVNQIESKVVKKFLIVILSVFFLAGVSVADDAGGDKRCIQIIQISNSRILDNRNILFEMSLGPDYLNTLPNACPGMGRNKAIMFVTSLSELCDLDMITVLDQVGGGFMRGATCGLGKFVPVEGERDTHSDR